MHNNVRLIIGKARLDKIVGLIFPQVTQDPTWKAVNASSS